jgi:Heterokaryon incompatibility protein (HET)
MRLLQRSKTGEFGLTEVSDDLTPPYAILSHTWGLDTEEVTFEDITNGTGDDKPGYEKIRFCGEQARQDGLQYFWADTCCINKANYAELQYAINSMFRWYRNATQCYVYLSDVSTPPQILMLSSFCSRGIQTFGKADGSLEDGRSRSFLRLIQSISSVTKAGGSVTKTH